MVCMAERNKHDLKRARLKIDVYFIVHLTLMWNETAYKIEMLT